MNYRMICQVLSRVVGIEAALLLIPMSIALFHQESVKGFLLAFLIAIILAVFLYFVKPKSKAIYAREGFFSVTFSWVLLSLVGAIPFMTDAGMSFVDALFETVSGFTTTGASILPGGPESIGRGLLFWRSLTHWLGGMGVLIFMMAVLPLAEEHSMHIMRAEVTGPVAGKLTPHMRQTSIILYSIYIALTVLEVLLLTVSEMTFYDALIHAFGTACTGGFSSYSASIAHFDSLYIECVIGIFMLLFGVNFNVYYLILLKKVKVAIKNEELWWYFGVVAVAIVSMALNLMQVYGAFGESLRYAFFQVAAIITTTAYSTADFTTWPSYSQWVLLLMMVVGGCAGSTSGGVKIGRIIILGKTVSGEIKRLLRPRSYEQVRLNNGQVDKVTIHSTLVFIYIYFFTAALTCLLLSFENLDFATVISSTVACLSNIGYGLSQIGPSGSFQVFSDFGKMVLIFCMMLGRLEIYPVLLALAACFHRKR